MTTDHSDLIEELREAARTELTVEGAELAQRAVDALEALTTERTITINDKVIEATARELANLEPGEPWPTNEELGGSLTGTRDDEYHDGFREYAKEVLEAAYDAQNPEGDPR